MSYNNKEYWQNRWKNNVYKDEFKTHTKEIDNIFNNQELDLISLLDKINIDPKKILEVGCGFGRLTKILSKKFPDATIVAIDIAKEAVDETNKLNLPNVKALQKDILNEKVDEHFDLIFFREVLLHFPDEQVKRLFKDLDYNCLIAVDVEYKNIFDFIIMHLRYLKAYIMGQRHVFMHHFKGFTYHKNGVYVWIK